MKMNFLQPFCIYGSRGSKCEESCYEIFMFKKYGDSNVDNDLKDENLQRACNDLFED